jgi:serine/threonine protein kinase
MSNIKISKYDLLEQVGKGGFGTVYLADDAALNIKRAVKILHPTLMEDPTVVERFSREARITARLDHPHIVPVVDFGEAEGRYFITMKFMPGGSLKERLVAKGPLPFPQALEITKAIASALQYAYAQPEKIIHRDLKPNNILFDEANQPRLTDFGFARAMAGSSSASHSASGGMVGTPWYMAPEIWGGKPPTPAADAYSLACILYEMLTGKILFPGDTPAEVVTKHIVTGPQFPKSWPPGTPAGLETVLRKGLTADPQDRYPNAWEFANALELLSAGRLQPPELNRPGVGSLKKKRSRIWWVVTGLVSCFLVVIVVIALSWWAVGRWRQNQAASQGIDPTREQQLAPTVMPDNPPNPLPPMAPVPSLSFTPTAILPTSTPLPPTETPAASPTSTQTEVPQDDPAWKGEYYSNNEFKLPVTYIRQDVQITFDWGKANPAPGVPMDNFSIRWTRCLNFDEGYYLFTGQVDDGLRVYLDDTKIMELSNGKNEQKYLVGAGQHCLKLEYWENGVYASVYFDYKFMGSSTPSAGSDTWKGEYYSNNEFKLPVAYTRQDAQIAFDWGKANPAPGVPMDNFSIRWTRCLNFDEGYYLFTGQVDDGLRVYLDDTKIMELSNGKNEQKYLVGAGQHCLKLEYWENGVDASVYFEIQPQ